MIDSKNKIAAAFLLGLFMAGCASTPPARVEDRSIGRPHPQRSTPRHEQDRLPIGSYRVQRGDTLYSIAFRNGMDYRDLAAANGIKSPYTILVGQVIRLDAKPAPVGPSQSSQRVVRTDPPQRRQEPAPKPQSGSQAQHVAPAPVVSTPPPVAPGIARVPEPSPAKPVNPSPTVAASDADGLKWQWPAKGARVNGYVAGDQTRQGIDIAGTAGDAVRSAADGVVVYSGNGLIGYGELIIVKHSTSMLSAYGHNRRRLVQEGDSVKLGQQIAEMGSTGAKRDMLHFEIRRNGKPVDPLRYLPAQ